MLNDAMMSSQRGDWETPSTILMPLHRWFVVITDPCAGAETTIGSGLNYRGGEQDGLALPWMGTAFVNPPYSRGIGDWMKRCLVQYREQGCESIALVPARTDTAWFQDCWASDAICFIKGRLKFVGAESSAPFPSALVYWGDRRNRFARAFGHFGKVISL